MYNCNKFVKHYYKMKKLLLIAIMSSAISGAFARKVKFSVDMKNQIILLNQLVTNYAIEQIYKEMIAYMKYTYDASTIAVPLSKPISDSNKKQSLEMRPFM